MPEMLAWFAEQDEAPDAPEGADGADEGATGDGGADDEPVPPSFSYPWSGEGVPDGVRPQMLEALPDGIRSQLPAWERAYAASVAAWASPT